MSTQKIRAIVIKERDIGESSKVLTLLVKNKGKMTVIARSVRKVKSKILHCCGLFCYADFELTVLGKYTYIKEAEFIHNFVYGLKDIYKISYSSYLLEITERAVMYNQESNDIMLLLIRTLSMMEKTTTPEQVSAVFQIKFLNLLGFGPDSEYCSICSNEIKKAELYCSKTRGFTCANCRDYNSFLTSETIREVINYVIEVEGGISNKIFLFKVSKNVNIELHKIMVMLCEGFLEYKSNSLSILDGI